jgi:hypothetical protein
MTTPLETEENKMPLSEWSVIIFAFLISAFILLLIPNLIVKSLPLGYIILKLQILFVTYSLSHLRTQLTALQIIFDGKKLVKHYVSAKMSNRRT